MALITLTLAGLVSWWVLLGIPAVAWLLWDGVRAQRKWRGFTITALAHDLIASPTAQLVAQAKHDPGNPGVGGVTPEEEEEHGPQNEQGESH